MNRRPLLRSRRPGALPLGPNRIVTSTLQNDIENALTRACIEQDLGVAEHLLRALETISCRIKNDEVLDATYLAMGHQLTADEADK